MQGKKHSVKQQWLPKAEVAHSPVDSAPSGSSQAYGAVGKKAAHRKHINSPADERAEIRSEPILQIPKPGTEPLKVKSKGTCQVHLLRLSICKFRGLPFGCPEHIFSIIRLHTGSSPTLAAPATVALHVGAHEYSRKLPGLFTK